MLKQVYIFLLLFLTCFFSLAQTHQRIEGVYTLHISNGESGNSPLLMAYDFTEAKEVHAKGNINFGYSMLIETSPLPKPEFLADRVYFGYVDLFAPADRSYLSLKFPFPVFLHVVGAYKTRDPEETNNRVVDEIIIRGNRTELGQIYSNLTKTTFTTDNGIRMHKTGALVNTYFDSGVDNKLEVTARQIFFEGIAFPDLKTRRHRRLLSDNNRPQENLIPMRRLVLNCSALFY